MKKLILALLIACLFALTGCSKEGEKTKDYRSAKSIADLEGITISAQSGTIHVDCANQIKNATVKEYPEIPDEVIIGLAKLWNLKMMAGVIEEK